MAVTIAEEATGTLSSTGSGTEDTVRDQAATTGVFQMVIDLTNLEGVDATIIIREYVQVTSGGADKLVNTMTLYGPTLEDGGGGENPCVELPVRHNLYGYKVTLEDDGSSKDFDWSLREIG